MGMGFNEYHLHQELVTEDIQYEDPLIRVEGFQEVENLSSAFRWKCYTIRNCQDEASSFRNIFDFI